MTSNNNIYTESKKEMTDIYLFSIEHTKIARLQKKGILAFKNDRLKKKKSLLNYAIRKEIRPTCDKTCKQKSWN